MEPIIYTRNGHFDFRDPDSFHFDIETIAHALSNLCRYTGHTPVFYSVAQHSVLASRVVDQEHALAALLHDAAEAFTGDMSAPLKTLCPDFRAIEDRVEAAIFKQFGVVMTPEVKRADMICYVTEVEDLMERRGDPHFDAHQWAESTKDIPRLSRRIKPWSPEMSRQAFLSEYDRLTRSTICA